MNYADEFKEYWNERGKYSQVNNPERLYNSISAKLKNCDSTAAIDDYVSGEKSKKETIRKVIVDFYSYLEKNGHEEIDSPLKDKVFYDYPFQRQLEIAKYLQEPHTLSETSEHFSIDERTLRKDLQELENGIEVLGSTIKVGKTKRAHKKIVYSTTMHPIFLTLNLTEVYALTVYLNKLLKCDTNDRVIRSITNRIIGQLSDYAVNKLSIDKTEAERNRYVDDEDLARSRKGIAMYLMKSGQSCSLILDGEKHTAGIVNYDRDLYTFRLEDGSTVKVKPCEAQFFLDELEYK